MDRVAKYNQLLRIEEELGDRAVYPGWDAFPRFGASAVRVTRYAGAVAEAPPRRTKIVATIGPPARRPRRSRRSSGPGVDGARLNLSHGTHDQHREWARLVREIEASSAGRSR